MQWGGQYVTTLTQSAVPMLPTASIGMVFQRICASSLPLQDTVSLKTSK